MKEKDETKKEFDWFFKLFAATIFIGFLLISVAGIIVHHPVLQMVLFSVGGILFLVNPLIVLIISVCGFFKECTR